MLQVFFTVDVEVWCDGWHDIDRKFPEAFRKYVYGPTARGNFGLPYQIEVLESHGLTAVFFVEPLFSTRFGSDPLAEIVGLLNQGQQEIQLHLHTEWVDESLTPLLSDVSRKRQHLKYFSLDEQTTLIDAGRRLLMDAGAPAVNAFRAGSFAFNRDTMLALRRNGIDLDSSYNESMSGPDSGVSPGSIAVVPFVCEGVYEYPMTVYRVGAKSLRHAQITACSYQELEAVLWYALESGWNSVVLLSHNFELMNQRLDRPDWTVVRRFERLCAFLDRNRDSFQVRGFHGLEPSGCVNQPELLSSPKSRTLGRMAEQLYRRIYR